MILCCDSCSKYEEYEEKENNPHKILYDYMSDNDKKINNNTEPQRQINLNNENKNLKEDNENLNNNQDNQSEPYDEINISHQLYKENIQNNDKILNSNNSNKSYLQSMSNKKEKLSIIVEASVESSTDQKSIDKISSKYSNLNQSESIINEYPKSQLNFINNQQNLVQSNSSLKNLDLKQSINLTQLNEDQDKEGNKDPSVSRLKDNEDRDQDSIKDQSIQRLNNEDKDF